MAKGSLKISIKGKYESDGEIKSTTIATLSKVAIDDTGGITFSEVAEAADLLAQRAQPCVYATVTGYTISYDSTSTTAKDYGEPGDVLNADEIFSDDFSDTQVTPTLQIVKEDDWDEKKTFNFKFMADPVDTTNFNTKVKTLSSTINQFQFGTNAADATTYTNFIRGDLTFTAKDTVATPD